MLHLNAMWVQWLDSLAPWTHAATFTCKRYSVRNIPITEDILVDTARHLIRRVNFRCFGKRARCAQPLPVVVTFGWGCFGDHPHLHFCFALPDGMSFESFSKILDEEANKTIWIDRQRLVKTYQDFGWMDYLIQHGTTNLIVQLINPSSSSNLR
jgi:hypothetical protein